MIIGGIVPAAVLIFVPTAHLTIAPRFIAGFIRKRRSSPEGATEMVNQSPFQGLKYSSSYPAVNDWAIFNSPLCGQKEY